jgi:hypothetical protein
MAMPTVDGIYVNSRVDAELQGQAAKNHFFVLDQVCVTRRSGYVGDGAMSYLRSFDI